MPSYYDSVKETTNTTGTGTVTMAGAVIGFRSFDSVYATAAKVFYCIAAGAEWEVGQGTLTTGTPWTMSRDTVYSSSNAGGLVSFSAGAKDIFNTQPAAKIQPYSRSLSASIGRITPILGFAGDSIANGLGTQNFNSSPLLWALTRLYQADVSWDSRTYANGGYVFGVGGYTTTQILANELPQIKLRVPNVLFVNGGTNDGMAAIAGVNTAYANMTALCDGALDAGVELIILYPVYPKTGLVAATYRAIHEFNRKLQIYANSKEGVYFVDAVSVMLAPASIIYEPIGLATAATGSVTQDGLHNSSYGSNAMSPFFEKILRKIAREKKPWAINQSDVFDVTENFHGNVLGTQGLMLSTGGTLNTVADTGIPAGWAVTTNNGFTVVAAIGTSIAPAPVGLRTSKFTLSGTATAAATLLIQNTKFSTNYFSGLPVVGFEVIVRCTNLTGVSGLEATLSITGTTSTGATLGATTVVASANDMESGDYHLFFYTTYPIQTLAGNNQHQLQIKLQLANGRTAAGSIEVMCAGIFNR